MIGRRNGARSQGRKGDSLGGRPSHRGAPHPHERTSPVMLGPCLRIQFVREGIPDRVHRCELIPARGGIGLQPHSQQHQMIKSISALGLLCLFGRLSFFCRSLHLRWKRGRQSPLRRRTGSTSSRARETVRNRFGPDLTQLASVESSFWRRGPRSSFHNRAPLEATFAQVAWFTPRQVERLVIIIDVLTNNERVLMISPVALNDNPIDLLSRAAISREMGDRLAHIAAGGLPTDYRET